MKQGKVIQLTEEIALHAARFSIEYKLPMADSMIYATSRYIDAVLWTQDSHFENLARVNYIVP